MSIMRMNPVGVRRRNCSREMRRNFIQLVPYPFGALENFTLTIQIAVHGTSHAASETHVILDLNGGHSRGGRPNGSLEIFRLGTGPAVGHQ